MFIILLMFIRKVFFTCLGGYLGMSVYAQESVGQVDSAQISILEHLQETGRISIAQDDRLSNLLGHSQEVRRNVKSMRGENTDRIVSSGFRIRVFSGNNQNESKRRAYDLAQEIGEKFPELETYVLFKTPNWRLTVGNFRTSEEAYAALRELKKEFPIWGREMFIIKDEIELPLE